jgi:signal transduction histidine kinase
MSTRSARSRRAFAGDGRGIGEAPGTGALAFLLDLDRALASVAPGEAAVALAVRLTANRLCADDCAFDEIDDDACAIPADEAVSPRRLVVSVRQGERAVAALTRLIDDLLDVSRISRGRIELRRGLISLGDVLRDATESVRPQVEQRGQMLVVDGDAHSLRLSGDSARLTQVFGNVLGNASKYTQNGGTIALSATRRGGDAVVRVLDNGRGIPHEMLDRVFEMFVQVDPSSESADGGLGIGLALSRRLVELHGGRIEARSEGPGRGTEVVVRLPLAGAASAGANGDRQDGEPAVKRILVVEETKPRDARLQ